MSRSLLYGLCLFLVAVFLNPIVFAEGETDEEKIELLWKLEKGNQLDYIQKNTGTQYIAGQEENKYSMLQETGTRYEVKDISEEKIATIEQKATYLKLQQATFSEIIELDSRRKEDLKRAEEIPLAKALFQLIDKPITFKIDKNGTVLEVEGYNSLMKEIYGKDDTINETKFSDDYYKNVLRFQFSFLPKKKLSMGESWTISQEVNMTETEMLNAEFKLTLEDIETKEERKLAKVKIEMTHADIKSDREENMTLSSFKGSGVYYFDIDNGMFVKFNISTSFATKIPNPIAPKEPPVLIAQDIIYSMTLKEFSELEKPKEDTEKEPKDKNKTDKKEPVEPKSPEKQQSENPVDKPSEKKPSDNK
ncbi:MAG: DUF6263 family protein [Planctomycetota bacterium]